MKSLQEFKAFYDSTLVVSLQRLESDRKKLAHKLFLFTFSPIAPVGVGLFLAKMELAAVAVISLVSGIVGGLLFYAFNHKKMHALKLRFKNEVIASMVKFIDESLQYAATGSISQREYSESKLFLTSVDRYSGDDLVTGTIGKTAVKFSEVHSEYKTTSTDKNGNKRETWHTIFKGIFFIGDFNKHFHGETMILPDTAESIFGGIGRMFQKMNFSRDQLVVLEDPEFEKYFCVYSNDQIEARYILSPKLMQRISELRKKSGKKIRLSFVRSKVYIAISINKNLFEPPFFGTMLNFGLLEEFFRYLHLSVTIVEELDLNTRIWTKE